MGLFRALFNAKKIPTVLVTLDALGTLYNFREPVAVQYQQVARKCGLNARIDLKQLDEAFKSSFKHFNTAYPNYGKNALDNAEVWWTKVVNRAFGQVVTGGDLALPRDLGSALYEHFSSGTAYELFPDVKPFLQSLAILKNRFTDHAGPLVLTGIVTNSDPRVRMVLQDMGFCVGPSTLPGFEDFKKMFDDRRRDPVGRPHTSPLHDYYNRANDFDFLCTSFDADAEKPDDRIWDRAMMLGSQIPHSRALQSLEPGATPNLKESYRSTTSAMAYDMHPSEMVRIHVGDEYSKDYLGAINAGWEALHLAREQHQSEGLGSDVKVVNSLDEAAMIVNLMAQEFFG